MPRVTITVPEKNDQPYRFPLDRDIVTLGRGSENDIAIDSGSVSVTHAEMRRIKGGYQLADVGSTNGIKQNGERCDIIPLHNGMTVHIGDVAFGFILSAEEVEILSREKSATQVLTAPARSPSPAAPEPVSRVRTPAMVIPRESSFLPNMMLLIFALAAFSAGLYFRFQKETGGNLIQAIKSHVASKPAAPAPKVGQ